MKLSVAVLLLALFTTTMARSNFFDLFRRDVEGSTDSDKTIDEETELVEEMGAKKGDKKGDSHIAFCVLGFIIDVNNIFKGEGGQGGEDGHDGSGNGDDDDSKLVAKLGETLVKRMLRIKRRAEEETSLPTAAPPHQSTSHRPSKRTSHRPSREHISHRPSREHTTRGGRGGEDGHDGSGKGDDDDDSKLVAKLGETLVKRMLKIKRRAQEETSLPTAAPPHQSTSHRPSKHSTSREPGPRKGDGALERLFRCMGKHLSERKEKGEGGKPETTVGPVGPIAKRRINKRKFHKYVA